MSQANTYSTNGGKRVLGFPKLRSVKKKQSFRLATVNKLNLTDTMFTVYRDVSKRMTGYLNLLSEIG